MTLRVILASLSFSFAAQAFAQSGLAIGTGGVVGLWESNCQNCHGARGQGGGAGTRTLLDDEWAYGEARGTDRELFDAIKLGMPESGMEAFGQTLRDEQIWALVVYIHELRDIDRRKRNGNPRPDASGVFHSRHADFRIETVIDGGISDTPWSIEFLPDGRMLLSQRNGQLLVHTTGTPAGKLSPPVAGTPQVRNRGQGGLMDIALHPDFAKNKWIYLAFSDPLQRSGRNTGMTKIVRGRLSDTDPPAWTDEQVIFQAKPEHYLPTDLHFGCKIAFDPKDASILFFGIGERGMADMAQDLSRPNGKIHRVKDDGTIPPDNPLVGQPDVYESIWSYGHRNPQGLVFDLQGRLWDTEHGPRGGDELNLIRKGVNYGWPIISFGMNYNGAPLTVPFPDLVGREPAPLTGSDSTDAQGKADSALAMPIDRWLPSVGVCGLTVSTGGVFPGWKGDLFAGGLSGESVDRFRITDGQGSAPVVVAEREEIIRGHGRVRDVVCAPDGSIYVVLNDPGKVIRLIPAE